MLADMPVLVLVLLAQGVLWYLVFAQENTLILYFIFYINKGAAKSELLKVAWCLVLDRNISPNK